MDPNKAKKYGGLEKKVVKGPMSHLTGGGEKKYFDSADYNMSAAGVGKMAHTGHLMATKESVPRGKIGRSGLASSSLSAGSQ
eukprot:m.19646 g.19646  ORF g.19646 m.19646 type:complete len:82 (+) comp6638_c1_seq1:145-390(+)